VSYLRECDPITERVIRASKTTAIRYERHRSEELMHMDGTKLGKIPRRRVAAHGRRPGDNRNRRRGTRYDCMHSWWTT
jgi:hypothetical protein